MIVYDCGVPFVLFCPFSEIWYVCVWSLSVFVSVLHFCDGIWLCLAPVWFYMIVVCIVLVLGLIFSGTLYACVWPLCMCLCVLLFSMWCYMADWGWPVLWLLVIPEMLYACVWEFVLCLCCVCHGSACVWALVHDSIWMLCTRLLCLALVSDMFYDSDWPLYMTVYDDGRPFNCFGLFSWTVMFVCGP